MDENDFEGSIVLEQLAQIGSVDAFFDAIDSDDYDRIKKLLKHAKVDAPTIAQTLREIRKASEYGRNP